MAEDDDLDIDLNDDVSNDQKIADISFDDAKDAGLDDFLGDVDAKVELPDIDYKDEVAHTQESDDVAVLSENTEADFANLNLDDFNTALDSFKAARAGKVTVAPNTVSDVAKEEEPVEQESSTADENIVNYTEEREYTAEPQEYRTTPGVAGEETDVVGASSNDESEKNVDDLPTEEDVLRSAPVASGFGKEQEIMNWYSGSLQDKTYKVSNTDIPEFLDGDNSIRAIHVSVDSPYGWNVFFDNGMFMSLRDVKEYQERHGELPCQDGKIIYGDKSCSFERILKIVVYEQPRYFSYQIKQ